MEKRNIRLINDKMHCTLQPCQKAVMRTMCTVEPPETLKWKDCEGLDKQVIYYCPKCGQLAYKEISTGKTKRILPGYVFEALRQSKEQTKSGKLRGIAKPQGSVIDLKV